MLSLSASLHATMTITVDVGFGEQFVGMGAVKSSSFTVHANIPSNALRLYVSDGIELLSVIQLCETNMKSAIASDTERDARLRNFSVVELNAYTLYYSAYCTAIYMDSTIIIGSVRTFGAGTL